MTDMLTASASVRRRTSRVAALRVCVPTGTNADFVASIEDHAATAPTRALPSRALRGIRRLLPAVPRRAKFAIVILATMFAVLLANFSAMPSGDNDTAQHLGGTPTANAIEWDCSDWIQFVCDGLSAVINQISQWISDGLAALVDSAINPNQFCDRTEMTPDRPDDGFSGFVLGIAQSDSQYFEHYNVNAGTTWAKYGAAGTNWNTYFLDCLSATNIVNYAADAIFGFSKIISVIAIVVFQQTFNSGLLNIFLGGNPPPVQQIIDDLNVNIYIYLSSLAIVIGAIVLAYRAIIKGFGLADFLSKFLVMVAVAGFASVFFTNAIPWVKWGNEQTNAITDSVVTALLGNKCINNEGREITLNQVDCTSQNIYNTLVYVPWANGEIGSLSGDTGPGKSEEEKRALATRILEQQAFTWADVGDVNDGRGSDEANTALNDALNEKRETKIEDRDKMVKETWAAKFVDKDGNETDFDPTKENNYSEVRTNDQSVWEMWSGGQGGQRFAIAVMAVIAAMTFGVMLIIISVTYLVLQIATVLFALASPFVFLIGLVPVYGIKILLRWGELFLGTFIKRVAMCVFVALLLCIYRLILDTDGVPWWLQMVLIVAIAAGGASYRKKITSMSTLGFSGGGGGAGLGSASQKVSSVRNTWRDTRGMGFTDRVAAAGRAGAAANPGVRGNVVNQNSQSLFAQQQQAQARPVGRTGVHQGYVPAPAGPAARAYGSYPVNTPMNQRGQYGPYGPEGYPYPPPRDGRDAVGIEGRQGQRGREGRDGREGAAGSGRGTYVPYGGDPGGQGGPGGGQPPPPPGSRGMGNR